MQEELSFGLWLRKQRRALDLSRQAFAKRVGCAEVTLRRIEAGTLKPSKELASILLEKLGIPESERLQWISFARGLSGFPSQSSPSSNKSKSNLPAALTTFIGREKEQAEIIQLIAKHRLVTLAGPGGVGKTRLSISVGEGAVGDYVDGVWLVEFAPIFDSSLVPQTTALTLGLRENPKRRIIDMLCDYLHQKRMLLLLDNCEHVLDASAQMIDAVLKACPQLKILTTSREPLNMTGEAIYRVPSLGLPDLKRILEPFRNYESIRLFEERAQLVQFDFSLKLENAASVAQICQYLDGIPLAIELAAAKVAVFSTEQIAKQLHESFNLLAEGSRTALPRQQTLRASINWSWNLLTESEQRLMQQLSVFAGGWTPEAAQSVCDGDVLYLLNSLVAKSLVVMNQRTNVRYSFHETIRQYAREKLWQAGEGELLRQRHLAYFVDLAERAEPNLRAFDMVMWLDRLEYELDNIRVALQWALESDIEAQLRLASALLWFWHIRGHRNEGIDWWERGLSVETAERGDQPLPLSRALIRGKALNAIGLQIVISFDFDRAKTYLEESRALFGELGSAGRQGMAYALTWLAGYDSQSKSIQEQNLTVFREIGDKFGAADCLMFSYHEAMNNNDHGQAITLAEEQLALRREIGDHDGAASALGHLGHLAFLQQDYQRAIGLFEEALSLFRAVGNKWGLGIGFSYLGDVFLWQRNYEQATKIYEEALAFARDISDRFMIALSSYNLGAIAWFQGDYARANQMIAESLSVFRDHDENGVTGSCMHTLGDIALAHGDDQTAMQWYETELAFGYEKQLAISLTFALNGLGKVAWVQGNDEVATKRFEEALRMREKAGSKTAILLALYGLGRVALSQRDYDSAHELLAQASEIRLPETNELSGWVWLKTYGVATAYPLEAFAVLAAVQNQMERAARLLGAVESLYASIHLEMSAKERAEHQQATTVAQFTLGEEAFAAAYEEGKKMRLDEAVEYALSKD